VEALNLNPKLWNIVEALNLNATPSAFMMRIRAYMGRIRAYMGRIRAYMGRIRAYMGRIRAYMRFSYLNLASFPKFANSISRR
jgi:hypothetical protein